MAAGAEDRRRTEQSNWLVTAHAGSCYPSGNQAGPLAYWAELKQSCPFLGNKMQLDAAQQDAAQTTGLLEDIWN